MRLLSILGRTFVQLARQVWLLPKSIAVGARHWRRQMVPRGAEAERLDRIRNPSKYRGK